MREATAVGARAPRYRRETLTHHSRQLNNEHIGSGVERRGSTAEVGVGSKPKRVSRPRGILSFDHEFVHASEATPARTGA